MEERDHSWIHLQNAMNESCERKSGVKFCATPLPEYNTQIRFRPLRKPLRSLFLVPFVLYFIALGSLMHYS